MTTSRQRNVRLLWRSVIAMVILIALLWLSVVPFVVRSFVARRSENGAGGLPVVPELVLPNRPLATAWGTVTASPSGPTRGALILRKEKNGHVQTLLRIANPTRKKLTGWQVAGPYLLVQVGTLSSAHPGNQDFARTETAIDLRSGRVLLNIPASASSHDYVLAHDLVVREPLTVAGRSLLRVTVVDLVRRVRLDFVCPPGTLGAVVQGGRILYEVRVKGSIRRLTASFAEEPWQPLSRIAPLYLPA